MTENTPVDAVMMNCVDLCDKEVDYLISVGQFVTHSHRIRYLYGYNYYDRSMPRKFTRKFLKFLLQHSRHKSLFDTIYLGG